MLSMYKKSFRKIKIIFIYILDRFLFCSIVIAQIEHYIVFTYKFNKNQHREILKKKASLSLADLSRELICHVNSFLL